MKHFIYYSLLLGVISLRAQTIQVPENCIDKLSPCLIRTEDEVFRFIHDNQSVTLFSEGIVKINFDEKNNNFELIEGRLSLIRPKNLEKKVVKQLSVNKIDLEGEMFFIAKFSNRLTVLNLRDFILKEYRIEAEGNQLALERSDFMNKKDFIDYTRNYFTNIQHYKKFLTIESSRWMREFKKQSENQTKVLQRSIALESLQQSTAAKSELEKNTLEANRLKKLKDEFFNRTFKR